MCKPQPGFELVKHTALFRPSHRSICLHHKIDVNECSLHQGFPVPTLLFGVKFLIVIFLAGTAYEKLLMQCNLMLLPSHDQAASVQLTAVLLG